MNLDQKLQRDLRDPGWQVLLIPEAEGGPAFAYTLGLYHSFTHPEILVMGLGHETLGQLLNCIGFQVKDGKRFGDREESADIIENYLCTFRSIDLSFYPEYLGTAMRFYKGDSFPALQCIWPDKQGFYPWQPGFNEQLTWCQTLLFDV